MTLTIDNFGRILIPKAVRTRLGLRTGSTVELDISDEDGTATIKSAERKEPVLVVDEYGIPTFVFDTDEAMEYDFVEAIRKDREERGMRTSDL